MPWYYVLPGVKQLINSDIEEAKEHMDMSADFPFSGHGSSKDDLEAITRSMKENNMPPLKYRIMHWSSTLSAEEQNIVKDWINKSIKLIKGEKK